MKMNSSLVSVMAYTKLSNEELAKELLYHTLHEDEDDGTKGCTYREGLGNHQSGGRKVKITLIIENA